VGANNQDTLGAIQWLNQHAADDDVVLEAAGGAQNPFGRISGHTGLATVLGWQHAVDAWQGSPATVSERLDDVAAIYANANPEHTRNLIRKYRIRYVVVGGLEKGAYSIVD